MDALVTASSGNVTTLGPKARKRALLFAANVTTLFAVVTILAACQTPSAGFCAIAKPMRPTAAEIDAMADQSVAAMLSHNERGKALCGWRP